MNKKKINLNLNMNKLLTKKKIHLMEHKAEIKEGM